MQGQWCRGKNYRIARGIRMFFGGSMIWVSTEGSQRGITHRQRGVRIVMPTRDAKKLERHLLSDDKGIHCRYGN